MAELKTRQYFLSTEIRDFVVQEEWKGLAAIGMVRSKRIIKGEESTENRYFITSLTDLQKFSDAVRKHWGIENQLHWCLDMIFDEDRCRTRVDNSGDLSTDKPREHEVISPTKYCINLQYDKKRRMRA